MTDFLGHVYGRFGPDDPKGWTCGVCGAPKGSAVRCVRPYVADGEQDVLDGASLRRLAAALPEGASIELQLGAHPYKDKAAILLSRERHDVTAQYWGGATVAEAADKCRESL